jgi:hypothetical protein
MRFHASYPDRTHIWNPKLHHNAHKHFKRFNSANDIKHEEVQFNTVNYEPPPIQSSMSADSATMQRQAREPTKMNIIDNYFLAFNFE